MGTGDPHFSRNLGTCCGLVLYHRETMGDDEQESERATIAAVCAGDANAFRSIVENHQQSVFRTCLHLLRDPTRAEDLAQDTFLTAFRKIAQFDANRGSLRGWLLTIARRLCINATRKSVPISLAHPPEQVNPGEGQPDRRVARSDDFEALDRALGALSDEHRRAFVLAEIEEIPHEEIARIEDIAIGTVKSRVSRAKLALRGSLKSAFDELTNRS